MKAVVCTQHGGPDLLEVQDRPDLQAKKGQVRIAVAAAGVNFPDTLIIQNKYQFKPPLPFVPGSEVAGVIDQVGEGVTGFEVGDPVVGMDFMGGYASQMVLHQSAVLKHPKGMSSTQAAGVMMTYGTSIHALKQRATLQPGEVVLVLGAGGGVGLAAVEIAKAMGAEVIAAASSAEKLAAAEQAGADHLINYSEQELRPAIKALRGSKGVDVLYDPVGGDMFEQGLRSMAWNGRALVIGFASGEIPAVPANLALLKSCAIVGVFWGAFRQRFPAEDNANFAQVFDWFEAGKINPHISKTYPLEDVAQALTDLQERRVTGKIVLTP